MSKVEIKLNKAGMREMLQSAGVEAALREKADAIANRCGEGYEANATVGRERALASVRPATAKAWRDNMENNTLLKNKY